MRRFEDIVAWQKARELVREIYRACGTSPFSRDFGLKDQICRAAVSTMSNVAEGFGRKTSRGFAHFLDQARGSALDRIPARYRGKQTALRAGHRIPQ